MLTYLRWFLALAGAMLLGACSPKPVPADPAIWLVESPDGNKAWLFGTIHAAPVPIEWHADVVERALGDADTVMVEVTDVTAPAAMAATFARLSRSPGHPALVERVPPDDREMLNRALGKHGLADTDFSETETWAAALTLARAASPDSDSANGVDRAVLAASKGKRIVELEGTKGQLQLFDSLAENEQADMLVAIARDAVRADNSASLFDAWRQGNMDAIADETRRGLLADPELREVLFTGRNRTWAERIATDMARGHRPFVAVGAAHMAGPDGLPALFKAKGYVVTRLD